MSTTIPFTKKNTQAIVGTNHDVDHLITEANEGNQIVIIMNTVPDYHNLEPVEISPSEYESPNEAIIADGIYSPDGCKLTKFQLRGYGAHALGYKIIPEVCSSVLAQMTKHDTELEVPHHTTVVQTFNSYNFGVFGVHGIEQCDHKRVYDPHDKNILAVFYGRWSRYINGFKFYNPFDLDVDFDNDYDNDCIYAVICDYYRDVENNNMVQNIVMAKIYH